MRSKQQPSLVWAFKLNCVSSSYIPEFYHLCCIAVQNGSSLVVKSLSQSQNHHHQKKEMCDVYQSDLQFQEHYSKRSQQVLSLFISWFQASKQQAWLFYFLSLKIWHKWFLFRVNNVPFQGFYFVVHNSPTPDIMVSESWALSSWWWKPNIRKSKNSDNWMQTGELHWRSAQS